MPLTSRYPGQPEVWNTLLSLDRSCSLWSGTRGSLSRERTWCPALWRSIYVLLTSSPSALDYSYFALPSGYLHVTVLLLPLLTLSSNFRKFFWLFPQMPHSAWNSLRACLCFLCLPVVDSPFQIALRMGVDLLLPHLSPFPAPVTHPQSGAVVWGSCTHAGSC